eukprot:534894-Pelagomonas_calceolata.AAC.2
MFYLHAVTAHGKKVTYARAGSCCTIIPGLGTYQPFFALSQDALCMSQVVKLEMRRHSVLAFQEGNEKVGPG